MRSGNLSGHLTLFTDRGAIDVAPRLGRPVQLGPSGGL